MRPKLASRKLTAEEAAELIRDGDTVATGGFVGAAHPEALTRALEQRFLACGSPLDLTIVYGAGQGDGKKRGLNHLAHDGLIKRVIGGHWGLVPGLGQLASSELIEAYNFPQGVICQLFRDIAAGRPGCITHIGLETFIDPEKSGGKLNKRSREELVERIELGGKPWLWYKSFPINIGLIRGTAIDPSGNLVMNEEAVIGEILAIAQAVRNCGGLTIAQVKTVLDRPAEPQNVRVPGILIDHFVLADKGEHDQTFSEEFNPGYCTVRSPARSIGESLEPLPDGAKRIIASRSFMEIPENAVANLGIGIPEGIARIAGERKALDSFILTVESGPTGGMPAGGLSFGASLHPDSIIDQPAQFDYYDGGGLDFAALGAAQIDEFGNVNVSKFGDRVAGVGGFVNISQTAKKVVFCGTFTASGIEVNVLDKRISILKEGTVRKFVSRVEQISFNAAKSLKEKKEVLYITERAVFRLCTGGIELLEIAPGIDLKSQVLDLMDFHPIMRNIRPMPADCFT